ncbi:MAG: aminotransferase, partial [Chloroflexota bacterium]
VRAACHELAGEAERRICELTNLSSLHADAEGWFGQMVSAPLPGDTDLAALKAHLYDKYRIEIPLFEWNGRKLIRVSIQGYNTRRDVHTLVSALREELRIIS